MSPIHRGLVGLVFMSTATPAFALSLCASCMHFATWPFSGVIGWLGGSLTQATGCARLAGLALSAAAFLVTVPLFVLTNQAISLGTISLEKIWTSGSPSLRDVWNATPLDWIIGLVISNAVVLGITFVLGGRLTAWRLKGS